MFSCKYFITELVPLAASDLSSVFSLLLEDQNYFNLFMIHFCTSRGLFRYSPQELQTIFRAISQNERLLEKIVGWESVTKQFNGLFALSRLFSLQDISAKNEFVAEILHHSKWLMGILKQRSGLKELKDKFLSEGQYLTLLTTIKREIFNEMLLRESCSPEALESLLQDKDVEAAFQRQESARREREVMDLRRELREKFPEKHLVCSDGGS